MMSLQAVPEPTRPNRRMRCENADRIGRARFQIDRVRDDEKRQCSCGRAFREPGHGGIDVSQVP